MNILYREANFPYNAYGLGNTNGNNGLGAGGFFESETEPPIPTEGDGDTASNCDEDKGWENSGLLGVCKPIREYQVGISDTMVYSWPSVEDRCYTNFNVNDMQKNGNDGNNIEDVYTEPITDYNLFHSQNRESCHNISNTARVINAENTFIGIHKDYPLEVTTSKAMRGYYLILKRRRYIYNEYKSKHTKQYGSGSSSPHWQKGGWMRWNHVDTRQGNYLKISTELNVDKYHPWTDQHGDTTEPEESDNMTGVRTSPLGAPLSTTRDYERHWTWTSPTGYNWRAIGESGVSGRTEQDDIVGLFRSYVPWPGLLPIPLDDQDTEINAWMYSWTAAIINYFIWLNVRDNGQDTVDQLTEVRDDYKAISDAKYTDYITIYNNSQQKYQNYLNALAISNQKHQDYVDANTAYTNAVSEFNDAVDAYNSASTAYNSAVTAHNDSLETYLAWYNFCVVYGPSGSSPNGWTDQFSITFMCGANETFVDANQDGVWDPNNYHWGDGTMTPWNTGDYRSSSYGWAATNYTNYNNALTNYNNAKATMDAALVTKNNAKADMDAKQAIMDARLAERDAAVAEYNTAITNTNTAITEYNNAVSLVQPAYDDYVDAQGYTDIAQTNLNQGIVDLQLSQDKVDLYNTQRNAYPENASTSLRDKIANPIYYTDSRLSWRLPQIYNESGEIDVDINIAKPDGEDHDGSLRVMDAAIHPTFVPRERAETGSVYIKNITIEKNGILLKAKDDAVGEFTELPSDEIYTDRSSKIKASGSAGQKRITFSNMYGNRSNIIHRYISTGFKIRFPEAGVYEISSIDASGSGINLTTNLSQTISSSSFTLYIPRGSPDPDYTWGQYDLNEFDTDPYATLVDSSQIHQVYADGSQRDILPSDMADSSESSGETLTDAQKERLEHVIFDSTSLFVADLFRATEPEAGRDTLNTLYASETIGMEDAHLGKAARHPFFSNELSESLHIRNDFFQWAYYEYLYFGAPAGQGGHISSKVKGNVSWDKYKWINYWEWSRTSYIFNWANEYSYSGFSNLNESEFDGFARSYTDKYGTETSTKVKQFFYGGIDKASSALWPCYENNIPAIQPDAFNQFFSTHYATWVNEFTESYTNHNHTIRGLNLGASSNNTPSLQKILDRPWFSYCAFSQTPGLIANFRSSLGVTNQRTVIGFAMTNRNITATNNSQRAAPWKSLQRAKYEKILKRPSVLAQYGYVGDMIGYTNADVGFANNDWVDHNMTIYESNDVISAGTNFKVSLHQAGTEFNDDVRNEFEERVVDDNQVGDGRSNLFLDNYRLYVVAK